MALGIHGGDVTLDGQVAATVIGGLIALVAVLLGHWYAKRQERHQWRRGEALRAFSEFYGAVEDFYGDFVRVAKSPDSGIVLLPSLQHAHVLAAQCWLLDPHGAGEVAIESVIPAMIELSAMREYPRDSRPAASVAEIEAAFRLVETALTNFMDRAERTLHGRLSGVRIRSRLASGAREAVP